MHRTLLPADETTTLDRIPVTSVHRTLLDLAAVLPATQLERAVERAEALRLADPLPLDDLLHRHRGARGTRALRGVLADGVEPALTRGELEPLFLSFLDQHGLPHPEVNADLWLGDRWIQADFLWRARRVIVEVDDRQTHGTRRAFERDRLRDRELAARGWRVLRITYRQLRDHPDSIARDLTVLLA